MRKFGLLGSSALRSAAVLGFSLAVVAPAYGQAAPAAQTGNEGQVTEADEPERLNGEVEVESGQDANASGSDETIVVTGSRIRRPNLESTVPITSVGPQELTERGDLSLGDALNQLPSMRTTFSQQNSTRGIGIAGLNLLDLRGLGTDRTLVLVNGRRHVSVIPGSFTVDVNTIPTDLLERVDVVTGGNSAVYGSDAVAGVVNFVLRRDFEGIRLRGQGGVSTYGDRGSYFVSATAGKNLFDNRLNIAGAVEYVKTGTVYFADRPYLGAYTGVPGFVTSEITNAPNRNFNGVPNTAFVDGFPGITFGNVSLGSYVSTQCPAAVPATDPNFAAVERRRALVCTGRDTPLIGGASTRIPYNFAFLPDGSLVRDDESRGLVDLRSIGGGVLGGLSATNVEGAMLLPGLERIAANLLVSGEFSSAFRPFLEAKYVRVTANQTSGQPTNLSGSPLPATYSINNPFLTPQARQTLQTILAPNATTFSAIRFNNDWGTRAEEHLRETYRVVAGVGGDISTTGNLRYELALNYGRTETYYETGGNLHLQRTRNALNAVLAPANYTGTNFVTTPNGTRAVCAINADASTANDDPGCFPINPFGEGATDPRAIAYSTHVSSREEWAEQINATAFLSGDTSGIFELPGGPIGFAIGAEYRKEDAYRDYDDVTASGATYLNAIATFAPPAVEVKEAFGELRIPILRDMPFFHELSLEGAARYSDYGGATGGVWAYNAGLTWAPVRDFRIRGSYARSVRAPNLTNLYGTRTTTFNGIVDPCNQTGAGGIQDGPNRAANCAAAGIPTTMTIIGGGPGGTNAVVPWVNTPAGTIAGFNQGNPDLVPEVGKSFTIGAVFQPRFIPGLAISVDYYNIKVSEQISGLTGQAIVNRCYDDPNGLDNEFCAAVFRRRDPNPLIDFTFAGQGGRQIPGQGNLQFDRADGGTGVGFINQPYNFAALKTSGIDADVSYRTRLGGDTVLNLRGIVSYLMNRESFSYITQPERSDRFHGTLGDPEWAASFNANLDMGVVDVTYRANYVGKQVISGFGWETFFTHQGRGPTNPDARPTPWNPAIIYHAFRLGIEPMERFKFYMGVDNLLNRRPPYELTGTTGNDAIYPATGRFFYAGAEVRF